jgi:hypothetical protein
VINANKSHARIVSAAANRSGSMRKKWWISSTASSSPGAEWTNLPPPFPSSL